jgi:excisionase family DNA binding protein
MSHTSPRLPPEPVKRIGYRINEFCVVIGIGRSKFYELRRAGKIRTVRVGGREIVPASEGDRVIAEEA